MKPVRLPTEFGVNMYLDRLMIIQQSELELVNSYNYFDENSPCHIYLVCKRPRVSIDPDYIVADDESITLNFKIQRKDKFEDFTFTFRNDFKDSKITLESEYPFTNFKLKQGEKIVLSAKAALFVQLFNRSATRATFLDLEILYIGQSYGVEGARTAPDRLKNHSTLQNIYATAMQNNPDQEIWLVLTSFKQNNLTLFDGRTKFSKEELAIDEIRYQDVFAKLNFKGINEQQRINFTEAALIRYFKPPYNIDYKNTFPNPAHKTYLECYDLDINMIVIELETMETTNINLFSQSREPKIRHIEKFFLNSPNERRGMFEIPR